MSHVKKHWASVAFLSLVGFLLYARVTELDSQWVGVASNIMTAWAWLGGIVSVLAVIGFEWATTGSGDRARQNREKIGQQFKAQSRKWVRALEVVALVALVGLGLWWAAIPYAVQVAALAYIWHSAQEIAKAQEGWVSPQ